MAIFDFLRRRPSGSSSPIPEADIARLAGVIAGVAENMTDWDMHISRLCVSAFRVRDSDEKTINYGLLEILASGLRGGEHDKLGAQELFDEAPDGAQILAEATFKALGREDILNDVLRIADESGMPRIVTLLTHLRRLMDKFGPPTASRRGEQGLMGQFHGLAEITHAFGLLMSQGPKSQVRSMLAQSF